MKRLFARLLAFLSGLMILFALLFTSLQLCLNDEGWFRQEYQKLSLESRIGIPAEDITRALMQLVYYMEGEAEGIQLSVTENGQTVEMYNEQEILHMEDVRELYQAFRTARNLCCILALILLALSALLMRGQALRTFSEGFLSAAKALAILFVALGIWVVADFSSFWTQFHRLFFDNDLWIMSYAECRMIRICPQQLFYDIVVRFALMFLIPTAVLLLLAILFRARGRRKEKEEALPDD